MSAIIQAENTGFFYPQQQQGLPPFSLTIAHGESYFIKGLSGCGKSTLARCLSGLIPHLYRGDFQGNVRINGSETRDTPLWKISEQVGMVFQNPAFQMLAPSVEEEILFGLENLGVDRSIMKQKLENALSSFGLTHLRHRSPQTLSGGEQQKVALAAILCREPAALILDEPLSMLDTTSAEELIAFLKNQINNGTALVICEHRSGYIESLQTNHQITLNAPSQIDGVCQLSVRPYDYPELLSPFTLEVNHLTVVKENQNILNNLDFSLASGQITAVVGRNGAGKTTLLRVLAGLQKYSGQVDIRRGSQTHKPGFSMVFQNPDLQIFNASVREEIAYRLPNMDKTLYRWLLSRLDLEKYEQTPPLLLSEGEKRRLVLATALIRQPQHGILLDEPSLGQDSYHKNILIELMRAVASAGYLVIFATHDLELAAMADNLFLLCPDGVISQGSAATVFQDKAAWKQLNIVQPAWMKLPCCD